MSDQHFLKLRPRGIGFVDPNLSEPLYDKEQKEKITKATMAFRRKVIPKNYEATSRQTVDNKPFICKTAFILSQTGETKLDDYFCELLADEKTLFSIDYQVYQTDHPAYYEDRKKQSKLGYCKNEVLDDLNSNKKLLEDEQISDADLEEYARMLDQIECVKPKKCTLDDALETLYQQTLAEIDPSLLSSIVDSLLDTFSHDVDYLKIEYDTKLSSSEDERKYIYESAPMREIVKEAVVFGYPLFTPIVFKKFTKIFPSLSFPPKFNADKFVVNVLVPYLRKRKIAKYNKEETQHYQARYSQEDWINFNDYKGRLDKYQKLLKMHMKWKTAAEQRLAKIAESGIIRSLDSCEPLNESILNAIRTETYSFLKKMRSHITKPEELSHDSLNYVVNSIGYSEDDFAFWFLIACLSEKKNMFLREDRNIDVGIQSHIVTPKKLNELLENPHKSKRPLKKQQRLYCICFLNELMRILELNSETRAKNWTLFLMVFGAEMLSAEEIEMWKRITGFGNKDIIGGNMIPLIELRFCAADRINSCFPVELEHLYCYESASYLHLGGYAKFVDCGTRVIQNCLSAIQNSSKTAAPKWEKIKASYLNQWGAISSNSDKVKTICDAACKLIRSPTLGEPYINFVAEHCDDRSAKELKMLIVETAIRLALIEDAKEKIGSKLEEVFSNLAAFETSLSGKKGGNTPE